MSRLALLRELSILAVLGLIFWLVREQVRSAPPSWFPGDIGVAAVPGLVNAALGLLLLVLAVRTAWSWRSGFDSPPLAEPAGLQWGKMSGVTLLYCLFIAAIAGTGMPFGLLAAAFLAGSLFVLRGGGWRDALISLAFGVIVSGLSQVLFARLFGVILP